MHWKKVNEQIVFKGWRDVIKKTFQLPDGGKAIFDVLKAADFVTVMAFTKKREAILVRQYRPGPEQLLTSFPEGGLENGEAPEIAAARELLEETGYQAKQFIHLKTFNSAYRTQTQICLLALDCEKVGAQKLDATEFIEVFLLPIEKFRSFLTNSADDSFTNVDAAYLALDYMGLL